VRKVGSTKHLGSAQIDDSQNDDSIAKPVIVANSNPGGSRTLDPGKEIHDTGLHLEKIVAAPAVKPVASQNKPVANQIKPVASQTASISQPTVTQPIKSAYSTEPTKAESEKA
jgi:hypothetical protein